MRWVRLLISLIRARFRTKLSVTETSDLNFRVWITDVDVSIMNHAALMTVYETGRIDFMVRTGFFKTAQKQRWFVPSSAIQVKFLKPLKTFQKAQLSTSILQLSENQIYLLQKIHSKGKLVSLCMVKSTVKKGRENVPTCEILRLLDQTWNKKDNQEYIGALESQVDMLNNFI